MSQIASIATAAPDAADTRQAGEIRAAAEAFESMFLEMLITEMRDAQLGKGFFGGGTGSSIYEGMFSRRLAEQMSEGSPLGIADRLEEQWTRQVDGYEQSLEAVRNVAAVRARKAYDASIGMAPNAGVATKVEAADTGSHPRISRPFGWGTDPIDGSRRFHDGIDLPSPAGTPVVALAPGTVALVRQRGGYGLQVVVEHANGWSSRYAHLSNAAVEPGATVARGQLIGRVGSSGRSTGPHLHLETLLEGQPRPPAAFLEVFGSSQVFRHEADDSSEGSRR